MCFRLGDIQPEPHNAQIGNPQARALQLDPGGRADPFGPQAIGPLDVPVVQGEPGPCPGDPSGEFSPAVHGQRPASAVLEGLDRLGQSGDEMFRAGLHFQLGGVQPGVGGEIGPAGRRKEHQQVLLRPRRVLRIVIADGQHQVAYLEIGVQLEIVLRGPLPVEVGPAGAGHPQPAEVDKAAQPVDEPVQIEVERRLDILGRAGQIGLEKVRAAREPLDDRPLPCLMGGDGQHDRLLPDQFLPTPHRRQVARLDAAFPNHSLLAAPTDQVQRQLPGRDRRVLVDVQPARQHRGEPGQVHLPMKLVRLVQEPADVDVDVWSVPPQAAHQGDLAQVAVETRLLDVERAVLQSQSAGRGETFHLDLIRSQPRRGQREIGNRGVGVQRDPRGRAAAPLAFDRRGEPAAERHLRAESGKQHIELLERHGVGPYRQPAAGRWVFSLARDRLEGDVEPAGALRLGNHPGDPKLKRPCRIGRGAQRQLQFFDRPLAATVVIVDHGGCVDDLDLNLGRRPIARHEILCHKVLDVAAVRAEHDVEPRLLDTELARSREVPKD